MLNSYSVKAFVKSPYIKFLIFTLLKFFGLIIVTSFLSFIYFSGDGKNTIRNLFPQNFFYCSLSVLVLFTKFNKKNIQYFNQYRNDFAMYFNFILNLITSLWFVVYITVFSIFCIINKYSGIYIFVFFVFNFLTIFIINIFQKQSFLIIFLYMVFIGVSTFFNSNPFIIYITYFKFFSIISGLLFFLSIFSLHKIRYINYSEKQIFFEVIRSRNTRIQNYLLFEITNLIRTKKKYLLQSGIFFVSIIVFLVLMNTFSHEKITAPETSWYTSIFYAALLNIFNILYGANIFMWNKDDFIEIKSKNFSMRDYITSKYLLLSIILSVFFILSTIVFCIFNIPLPRLVFIYLVDLFFIPLYAVIFSMLLLKPMEDVVRQMILGTGFYTILIPAILPYEILTKFFEVETVIEAVIFAFPICAISIFIYQKVIKSLEISIANKIRKNIFKECQITNRET